MKFLRQILLLSGLLTAACGASDRDGAVALIPAPRQLVYGGGSLDLGGGVEIVAADSLLRPAAEYLTEALVRSGVAVAPAADRPLPICLELAPELASQAYELTVRPAGAVLRGGSYEGVIAAAATLRQLMWGAPEHIPSVEIADEPRFAWRGVMLDVSRHFFTEEEVMDLMDCMALYKFNRLHLHLTDDQGWRLESERYPLLTEKGAWRLPNNQDSVCLERAARNRDDKFRLPEDRMRGELYGGFYTRDDMRQLIAYAAQRGIEIIPEIDLPGHSLAAMKAYPHLACDGCGGGWGVNFSTPLCLGDDRTLAFCRHVLEEVCDLFPSQYIHIGGDEVERTAWEQCPKCRTRVRTEGLDGIAALQPWFSREMERFCREKGKTVIGWDEVTDDGLTPRSVIMWWRSWAPGTLNDALQQGHEVILTPSEYLYLSEEQDRNSLRKVYDWEPASGTPPACQSLIRGIQGNLWAEHAPSKAVLGERLFPRLLAVAETAWVDPGAKDFGRFSRALPEHLVRLGLSGWNYRMQDAEGVCDRNVFEERTEVALTVPRDAALHYTLDGSVPDTTSLRYDAPFPIDSDCVLTMRCYNALGIPGPIARAAFRQTGYLDAVAEGASQSEGLLVRWYDFAGERCADIDKAPLKANFICGDVRIPEDVVGNIGLIYDGFIEVPADGTYSFYTYSDDGSILSVDGTVVVDNDGLHSREERSGQALLRRGLHKFSLRYFDSNGGILQAGTIGPDGERTPFADDVFKH